MIQHLTSMLPFQPSRLLYRETHLDHRMAELIVDYLGSVGRQVFDWGDVFRMHHKLSDGNVPEIDIQQHPHKGIAFLVGRWPVLLRRVIEYNNHGYSLTTLAIGPSGQDIVKRAVAWHSESAKAAQFAIFRVYKDNDSPGDHLRIDRSDPPDRSGWYVVPEAAEEVRRTVRFWLDRQSWYHERGMPWRMGVELEGPPGTGKSTLVRAMAQEMGVPLFVVEPEVLEEISDWSEMWRAAMIHVRPPLFVLIEDFDLALRPHLLEGLAVGDGSVRRRNSRTTLSSIMNLLDGVSTPDGVCFFVTTNNPQDVEQAAVRPGRIDRVVHVGPAPERVRLELARRVLLGFGEAEIARVAAEGEGESAAAFRNRCQKLAIGRAIEATLLAGGNQR